MEWQNGEFLISTDPVTLDIPFIHKFLSERSYWAKGIPVGTVSAFIGGSLCFGMYAAGRQIGFARVITDRATFGYLADVFVDEDFRGRGLSKWMMVCLLSHPELQGFRRWMLATRDAHGLYEQFGFGALEDPHRIMQKTDPDIYRNNTKPTAGSTP
jgi:GNAT superfamily N-acetyltransferase